jgi:hypothetical protein
MKVFNISLPGASLALLVIQLALVSSIALKYLYQRQTCPRVWTRADAYDPELPMRGRYLSLQLTADGCKSTWPGTKESSLPKTLADAAKSSPLGTILPSDVLFPAELKVEGNKLMALRIQDPERSEAGQTVSVGVGAPCNAVHLFAPVFFYIAEHAQSPLPVGSGQELWIEVTVPPSGPPRPIQLALKQDGVWKPLSFQ